MSMALDWRCFIESLQNPTAVTLSTCIGVGGWGCPISSRAIITGTASFASRNIVPTSDSMAELMTVLIIFARVYTIPFLVGCVCGGYPGVLGFGPRKNSAPALLQAFVSER